MTDTNSYIPKVPWEEHLQEIAHRYPYTFPTAITSGPHPIVGQRFNKKGKLIVDRVPGGLHNYSRIKKHTAAKQKGGGARAFVDRVSKP